MGKTTCLLTVQLKRGSLDWFISAAFRVFTYRMPAQGLYECMYVYVCCCCCKTDFPGEGQGDVISVGKCYSLRGLFTLISHTHEDAIHYVHAHADALTLLHSCTTHTWFSLGRDYQADLLWYTESSLEDKLKCTHQLLSLVWLCWFRDKPLVIVNCVFFQQTQCPWAILFPCMAPRTCKHSRYYLPTHGIPVDPHETWWFASQNSQPFCDNDVDYSFKQAQARVYCIYLFPFGVLFFHM